MERSKQVNQFLRAWAWKREHRSDKERFELPYRHKLLVEGVEHHLVIEQRPFRATGFASTVWDSSIVLAKYLEKCPELVARKRCIELGAGCGLVGIIAACMGANDVVMTDFPENLSLLRENCRLNQVAQRISVQPLVWGSKSARLKVPYDVILATDVMYYTDATDPLLTTLLHLSSKSTVILLAYGRNRQAEEKFVAAISDVYAMELVPAHMLDELYHCDDVDVYKLWIKNP